MSNTGTTDLTPLAVCVGTASVACTASEAGVQSGLAIKLLGTAVATAADDLATAQVTAGGASNHFVKGTEGTVTFTPKAAGFASAAKASGTQTDMDSGDEVLLVDKGQDCTTANAQCKTAGGSDTGVRQVVEVAASDKTGTAKWTCGTEKTAAAPMDVCLRRAVSTAWVKQTTAATQLQVSAASVVKPSPSPLAQSSMSSAAKKGDSSVVLDATTASSWAVGSSLGLSDSTGSTSAATYETNTHAGAGTGSAYLNSFLAAAGSTTIKLGSPLKFDHPAGSVVMQLTKGGSSNWWDQWL